MLRPAAVQILKNNESYYSLVIAVAKRAREITDEALSEKKILDVKPVKTAISLMPTATYELPYDGAKEMLLVDNIDSKEFLTELFNAMYDELPAPKNKK